MFSKTLKYWKQRKKQFGDKCVGNVGEDHNAQGGRIRAELDRVLGNSFYDHGLDYGCGYGRITPSLVAHCGHTWAVDLFSDWSGRAGATSKTVTPVVASAYELPFEDGAFDLVLDAMTLQSMDGNDWTVCARELARVTAIGGTIITLMKQEMATANDCKILSLLQLVDQDPSWYDLNTIDKSGDMYCLIVGTRV